MSKYFTVIIIILLFASQSIYSQTPELKWAKQIFGTTNITTKAIVTDKKGNLYTVGEFYGTVDFDPNIGQFIMTSEGLSDIYITKIDSTGLLVWAKHLGGLSDEYVESLALDSIGNIYSTGAFSYATDFDPGTATFTLNVPGVYDAFISKLDSNGNFIWAKQIGGPSSNNMGRSISVNKDQEIYILGYYTNLTDFDPSASTFNLTSNGPDVFIAKFNSSGQFIWAKGIGGTNLDFGNSVAFDQQGNIYSTGFYDGNVDFNPGIGIFNMSSVGTSSMFILKLNANGEFIWAKNFAGSISANGKSLSVDTLNNIYSTGEFEGVLDFDPGLGVANLTSAVSTDIFISKLDSAGNFIWAKHIWGTGEDQSNCIVSDQIGNLYLTGSFKGTCDFNPDPATSFVQTATNKDIFIVKIDASGNFQWGTKIGGNSVDYGTGLALDQFNHVYNSGVFSSTAVDFNPGISTTNLYAQGYEDGYLIKLNQCGSLNSALTINACNEYTWNGMTYTSTGVYTQSYFNINGCDSISQLNLTLQNVNLGVNQVGNLLTANALLANYQWINCDNNAIIPGATNQTFNATSSGNYAVIISQACTDTSACFLIAPVNINEIIASNNLVIYPNPVTDKFILNSDLLLHHASIEIKNCLGQTIFKKNDIDEKYFELNVSNFAKGIYFLKLIENKNIHQAKFLIE